MLRTRIITSIVLFAALLLLLFSGYDMAFQLILTLVFGLASWECFRLFGSDHPVAGALFLAAILPLLLHFSEPSQLIWLLAACVAIWVIKFTPALKVNIPPLGTNANRVLMGMYAFALLGFFAAMYLLYRHSPVFLLSIVSVVFIADIGAYSFGKTFGVRKLAPQISPSKTWAGAVGGWASALVFATIIVMLPGVTDTFMGKLRQHLGMGGMMLVMTLLVSSSVVGDLFESRLKRRVGMKDSSNLVPGHGGVLDRIDALLPVLPLACLLDLLI